MNFQKTKMARTMLSANNQIPLSDFGKTKLTEIGKEAFESWRDGIVKKQESSLEDIEKYVNSICEKLIIHFNLPIDPEKLALSAQALIESEKKFEVANTTSVDKIHPDIKKIIDSSIKPLKKLNDLIESVYLVGSAGREDFIPSVSNATFIFITRIKIEIGSTIPLPVAEVNILSKEEFNSEVNKKIRFFCYSDGLLILGKESSVSFSKLGQLEKDGKESFISSLSKKLSSAITSTAIFLDLTGSLALIVLVFLITFLVLEATGFLTLETGLFLVVSVFFLSVFLIIFGILFFPVLYSRSQQDKELYIKMILI